MKRGIIFLIFLLILISSCSKEAETKNTGNITKYVCYDGSVVDSSDKCPAVKTASPALKEKERATLAIHVMSSDYYQESSLEKGNFFVLQLKIDNSESYGGFIDIEASCLQRDAKGDINLNSIKYRKVGSIEKSWSIKPNEVGIFKAEGCFEKTIGKTDKIRIGSIGAYRFT